MDIPNMIEFIITIFAIFGASLSQGKKIKRLERNQGDIKDQITVFKAEYNKNADMFKNLAYSHDAAKKVIHTVKESSKYFDPVKDASVLGLISANGDGAKTCIDWAVETGLKDITFEDFKGRYEGCSIKLREYLDNLEPEFMNQIKGGLADIGGRYMLAVKEIIECKVANDLVGRFVTETDRAIQKIFVYLVQERSKFNNKN